MIPRAFPLLGAVCVCASSVSAASFEGRLQMEITAKKASHQIDYELRDGAARMTFGGAPASVIIDGAKQQLTVIMDERQMYFTRPIPTAAASGGESSGPGASADIKATGETKNLLGYTCKKYVATGKGGESFTIWATDELGPFLGFGGMSGQRGGHGMMGGGASSGWEQALQGRNFFPLLVEGTDGAGEAFKLQVTSIHKEKLPDGDFAPPAGYRDLSSMMGMMGGMGR